MIDTRKEYSNKRTNAPTAFSLSGHRALITGASGGLGAHFARVLAMAGADIVIAARRKEKLDEQAEAIAAQYGQEVMAVSMDVTQSMSVQGAFAAITQSGPPCDIIINNSGVAHISWMVDMDEAEWAKVMDTNVTGVWRVASAAANALKTAQQPGSIINIASVLASNTALCAGGYATSKAAVAHMTRSLAVELTRSRIRVNAIAPGYFLSDINRDYLESDAGEKMRRRVPMQRFGDYHELDGALLLLASDAGSYMTGTTIAVDGGHGIMPAA
ncbi:SDR family NAD(P)-dependent oxidoreductase [Parasphingorhabdus sp. DH2-15]|uniref:SDR family NAD(P)-dependent oxidoreductase n=1 Tax=Parasphingorhabdus sp. DH2-15 TaxID=3444112 RepID=UPI003F682306